MPTTLELPRAASLTSMNHATTSEDVKMKEVDLRNFSSWEHVNGCTKGDENCKTERKILKVPYLDIFDYEFFWLLCHFSSVDSRLSDNILYLDPIFNQTK